MERNYEKELLDFIQAAPSAYHVIEEQKKRLLAEGYEQLLESANWTIRAGGKYFVTRNGSAIIAFRVPEGRRGSGTRWTTRRCSTPPCRRRSTRPSTGFRR